MISHDSVPGLPHPNARSCREAGEPAPTAHDSELGVLCAAHDRSAQRLTGTESAPSSRRRRSAPPDVAPVRGHESRHLCSAPTAAAMCGTSSAGPGESIPELRAFPTESPQVRVRRVAPHKKPTDKMAFPGTRRHGCYHGRTTPNRPLCRQCRAGAVDSSRGPGGYRPSCKRQVSGSNPLTGSHVNEGLVTRCREVTAADPDRGDCGDEVEQGDARGKVAGRSCAPSRPSACPRGPDLRSTRSRSS